MTSRQVLRYLSSICILGMIGLFASGCAMQDPPALGQIYSARDAISAAKKSGADERHPEDFAELEKRYLATRGTFYACQEGKAGDMAQALIADANALANKKAMMAPEASPANMKPLAGLEGPTEGMTKELIPFDASSTSDADGDPLRYMWDFGDGKTAEYSFPNTTHRYSAPGLYTVLLTVKDGKGGESQAQQQIVIREGQAARQLTVLFGTNGSRLSSGEKGQLDAVASDLAQDPQLTATIVGHTDSTGDPNYNQQLSVKRAKSVGKYLESKGIAASRLNMDGRGANEPVASNDTAEGRHQNRRADVVW